ncbi:MAG: HDOD domain-containing protein, partial [bacterium]
LTNRSVLAQCSETGGMQSSSTVVVARSSHCMRGLPRGSLAAASSAAVAAGATQGRTAGASRDGETRAARTGKPPTSGSDEGPPIAVEFLPPRAPELWRPLTHAETPSFIVESFAGTLPEPVIATNRLAASLDDPSADPRKIARIAASDPSLAARILNVVNSPFYALPKKTADMNRAVMILGYSHIKRIVYRMLVGQALDRKSGNDHELDSLWEHSFLVSVVAPIIAHRAGVQQSGSLSTAGLLLEVGKMALQRHDPEKAKQVYGGNISDDRAVCQLEEEMFGMNHGVAGAILAKKWNLPPEIVQMIELHVQPHFCATPFLPESGMKNLCVLHLAEAVVRDWLSWRAHGLILGGDDEVVAIPREPDAVFFEILGFDPSLACLQIPAVDKALEDGSEFIANLAAARAPRAVSRERHAAHKVSAR